MALQNFVNNNPPTIKADFLNGVDALKTTVFNDSTNKVSARTALTSDAPLEVGNGGTGARTASDARDLLAAGLALPYVGGDGGVANAAVVTPITPFLSAPSLIIGLQVAFTPIATNTGATTLNFDGTGVQPVVNQLGNALTGGELSMPLTVQWTGAAWKIVAGSISPALARTTAEITAAVIPSSYLYAPNNVRRYGALGDGVTDDTAAITRAISVSQYSGVVFFPGINPTTQTVYLCNELSPFGNSRWYSDGNVVLRINTNIANKNIIDAQSIFAAQTNLSVNATVGATSVTTASNPGLVAGQLVEIFDQTFKFGSSGQNLELNVVVSVTGAGPFVTNLENALIGSYATASTAGIKGATKAIRNLRIENLQFDIPTTMDGGGVIFNDCYECGILNCKTSGPKSQAGFTFWRSAYCLALGVETYDGQNQSTPGFGYGFSMGSSAHNCIVADSTFRNVRENAMSDNVRFSGFCDCQAISVYDNGFNTHGFGASDCWFYGCRVYFAVGPTGKGFYSGTGAAAAPDLRILYVGCSVFYSNYIAFWADGLAGLESQDITYVGCKAYQCGVSVATSFGFYAFRSLRPRIIDCEADGLNSANVRSLVKVEICTEAMVQGGRYKNASSGWGIIHANCTRVQIDDNTISGVGANQGVQAESTASTAVLVRRNRVDNDTPFTKNTGDIHEFNEYNTKRQNNRGQSAGTVADGGTIAHGCVTTPYNVTVTPLGGTSTDIVKPSAVGGTNITVSIKTTGGAAGTAVNIMWTADS